MEDAELELSVEGSKKFFEVEGRWYQIPGTGGQLVQSQGDRIKCQV